MSNLAKKESPTFSAIYTIAEAARLCGLSQGQVRRWIQSSSTAVHTPRRVSKHGVLGLDFLDLIELRYVKAFIEAGISWHVLRAVHERAATMLRFDHPFATKNFLTDGHNILSRIAEIASLKIATDQHAFSRIVDRYLVGEEGLDFDADGMAVRWWPMGKKRLVVLDTKRSFGQPIVDTEGVPTAVLYKAYLAESGSARNGNARNGAKPAPIVRLGQSTSEPRHPLDQASIARVANWYIVEESSVRAAIDYESDFLALA